MVIFSPDFLEMVQDAFQKLLDLSNEGAALVFGNLASNSLTVTADPLGGTIKGYAQIGFVFAVGALPTIIFIAMLTAVLYHMGILTRVVHGLAWVMQKTMGTSGAETLSTAANIFVGQTEAPLIVKPFLEAATNSEMMAIMVGGFANIASGVLVVYANLLKDFVPNAGGHLALACFISAPATLVVSKLMMPELGTPITAGGVDFSVERLDANLIDAASRHHRRHGPVHQRRRHAHLLHRAVALLNAVFGHVLIWMHISHTVMINGHAVQTQWKLEEVLGYVMAPIMWLCGMDWAMRDSRRLIAGNQNCAQRIPRLSGDVRQAPGRSELPDAARGAADDLCVMRLCQLRVGRNSNRRHQHNGPDATKRSFAAGINRHGWRRDRVVHGGVRGGGVVVRRAAVIGQAGVASPLFFFAISLATSSAFSIATAAPAKHLIFIFLLTVRNLLWIQLRISIGQLHGMIFI